MQVVLERIRNNGGTQTRVKVDDDYIEQLAEAYKNGEKMPPVALFDDGKEYWVGDGHCRVAGAVRAGCKEIEADVRKGTRADAVRFSAGANKEHDKNGLRRTREDKHNAVQMLLSTPEWAGMSDNAVADDVGVSHHTVANVRASMPSNGGPVGQLPNRTENGEAPRRRGKDGKSYRASKTPKLLCERCRRIAAPNGIRGCDACKALNTEREPGDDTESEKAAKDKSRSRGKAKYKWANWDKVWGNLCREMTRVGEAYGARESPEYTRADKALIAFGERFGEMKERLLGIDPEAAAI